MANLCILGSGHRVPTRRFRTPSTTGGWTQPLTKPIRRYRFQPKCLWMLAIINRIRTTFGVDSLGLSLSALFPGDPLPGEAFTQVRPIWGEYSRVMSSILC